MSSRNCSATPPRSAPGAGTVPHQDGEPELDVIPGMLLNRLNPLKGLDDEQRKAFIAEFRHKSEAFGNRDLRLALMDEQGIDKALMFPAAAHDIEYEFVDNIPALYANIRAFNRWMHEEVGYDAQNRMFLPPYIALADPDLAVKELATGHRRRHHHHPNQIGPRPRRRQQPRRRPLPRRPHLRPVLVHRQRSRHPPGRPPRRHRLPEVRRRLVRRPRKPSSATSTPSNGSCTGATGPPWSSPPASSSTTSSAASRTSRSASRRWAPSGSPTPSARWTTPSSWAAKPNGPPPAASTSALPRSSANTSSSPPIPEENVRRIVAEIGIDPIVFGSDFPHGEGLAYPDRYVDAQLNRFNADDQRKIMRDNLENFLTFAS